MFFKRIELVGFKSFASKTVCDFIPGTTVIVGPNGCGKSNILDAIKWVLGEQAASQMRGKKMQDVIFAGSASFKALGVAQVTLTLDNSSRLLPLDYDEVQVTRRLFRNGESEYLINKTASRLRDVHDLFLGTGIGKSAYSMLEQGRVSQIVEAKPQERRFLFEEAAGISKFKIRKLEALRKLERTDVDLSRLNDLLSEVERQVGSLKRQASKAERYKELHDACKRGEQELTIIRSRELREKVGSLDGVLNELRDKFAGLSAELGQKRAEEEAARDREADLTDAITDQNQATWDLKQNLTEAEHQIHRLNDQIGAHARRIEQIQGEFHDLDVQASELELRLQESELRFTQADTARQTHNQEYEELSLQYFALQETVQERTRRIDELGSEVAKLRQALARAENEVRMAEGMIARHDQDREQGGSLLNLLEEQCLEAELQHEDLARREGEMTTQLTTMQEELEQQRNLRRERQESLAQRMRALQDAARGLHESGSRLETLRELSSNYEGYYQGVREAMLAADRGELRGVLGIATNLIRAKGEHELAIEVALATHLQDIVVRTADDGKGAIEYLKRHGRGRATFLPLDRLRVEPLHHSVRQVLGRSGVLGIASELVQYDRDIQVAVDYLLGSTIVVRDLDVAIDLGRQGYRARYVSLDGQLINPGGAMTGGRIQATGLMTREREIRDLEARVAQLEREQQQGQVEIARLQDELSGAHNRAEQLQGELEIKRLEHNSLKKDLEAAVRAQAEAERARQERGSQLERIDQEIATQRATLERASGDVGTLTTQLFQAEERLAAEKDSARSQSDDIYTLGVSLAEARTATERERERAEGAQREQAQIRHDLENLSRLRQGRQREIEQLQAEDALIVVQIDRIKQEMEGSSAEFERLNRVLVNCQAEREELVGKLKELTENVQRLERDERAVDNELREIELRHLELQTNFDNLSEQCVEKFGKNLLELAEELGEIEDRDQHALHTQVVELRDRIERMGIVNMAALDEYKEQAARFEYLKAQHKDLTEAKEQLLATIQKLDETTRKLFQETFESVRTNFIEVFRRLFNGGRADLLLEAPEGTDPFLDGGVEFLAQPPGKQVGLNSLSGGEKAMTAIALLFALFLHKPSPFCIMDEIDAPLDDANVERFKNMVAEFSRNTQFVVITHNKLTMELADAIYGVTMEEMGVSKLVSVRFQEAEALVDAV